jgi:ABC-type microcin C transport system duplicated ATPase subunit YejF
MNVAAVDGTGRTQKDDERRAEAVLRFRDFSVRYGMAPPSVRGIDLTVRAGEIVGLIGESGSGKTSVAMACLGLLPKQAQVSADLFEVCGTDLAAADDRALTRLRGGDVAMVFQDAMGALDPSMRIGRQIGEVLTRHRGLKGEARQRAVLDLLSRVRVPDPERRVRQYPHQLSGGLRQCGDGARAGGRTTVAPGRRADDGAGRHGAGGDPAAAQDDPRRVRCRDPADLA